MKFNGRFILFIICVTQIAVINNGCGIFSELREMSSSPQIISENIKIDTKWTAIKPKKPLEASAKIHKISIRTDEILSFDENDKNLQTLKFKNGRIGKIEATLYDDTGEKHPLSLVGVGGSGGGFYLGKISNNSGSNENDFPSGRKYIRLEIRSDVPFQANKIEWVSEIQK